MLGMMCMELTISFYTAEVPVEQVEDMDASMQLVVKVLISL
jgi:hypothetical protein